MPKSRYKLGSRSWKNEKEKEKRMQKKREECTKL